MGTSSALENLYKSMTYDPASRCLYAMSGQFTHENTYINHTVTEVLETPGKPGICYINQSLIRFHDIWWLSTDPNWTLYTHTMTITYINQ